ncbi:MAG TPA: transglutaminase family protein [Acidimicrobiales bacterium]
MKVRVGCEFEWEASGPTPSVWQIRARPEERILSARWETDPEMGRPYYCDAFGNVCDRLILQAGTTTLTYDAVVEVSDYPDPIDIYARQAPVEELPADALVFLLPSRFCQSDVLYDDAWKLFGHTEPGWQRVQAVSNWVHENVHWEMGTSTPTTTAADVYQSGTGVCRDFAHLGVTFCRALNVPARYVFGYLPDIAVPKPDEPMDFCAWMEVYLGDRWWTFDPRNNTRRIGRVVIGKGRDAVDVAMVTTYGAPVLQRMKVWADQA